MIDIKTAALAYKARGWSVIPVVPRGKAPRWGDGWPNVKLTEAEIESIFGEGDNVGVILGVASGWLVDVDLDAPEAVAVADYFIPETGAVFGRKGKPRSHRLFVCEGATTVKHRFGPKKAGGMIVELRSTGGQTVFPPGVHESGEQIEWVTLGKPRVISFDELRRAVVCIGAAALLIRYWPAQGSRHDAALALAGGLLRDGWTETEVVHFIRAVCHVAQDEEVEDRVKAVASSAARLIADAPTTGWPALAKLIGDKVVSWVVKTLDVKAPSFECEEWEPPIPLDALNVPDFPLDALPSELWGFRGFCAGVSESLQIPIEMAVMIGLAVAGALLAKRMVVHVRADWFEAVNLFLAILLPPAERKSATYRLMTEPLCEIERREIARMASIVAQAAFEVDAMKAEQQHLKLIIAKQGDGAQAARLRASEIARKLAEYKVPVLPKLILDDVTPEAVSRTLSEQGGRVAIMSAEGDLFDIIGGRYSRDGAPNLGVFLKGHAGDDIRVDRVSKDRPSEIVRNPALTIALTAQPVLLHGLLSRPGFRGRGLLARFCWVMPESRVGRRAISEQPIPTVLKAKYAELIEGLALPEKHDEAGKVLATVVELTPDAREAFKAFETATERELSSSGSLAMLTDWGGKLCGLVARLAGILHGMQHAPSGAIETPISRRTIESAITIGRYLTEQAKAAFGEMGADPAVSMARRILDWVRDSEMTEFTKRDAFQRFKSSIQTVDGLDAPLRVLRNHGYIRDRIQEREPGKPGRPGSPVYEVNHLGSKPPESSKPRAEGDSGDSEDIERDKSGGEAAA